VEILDPFRKPRYLYIEDHLAAPIPQSIIGRHEGVWIDSSLEHRAGVVERRDLEGDRAIFQGVVRYGISETVSHLSIAHKPLHVHIGDCQVAVSTKQLAFCQQRTVLGYYAMAAEDDIGGRFMNAAARIDIGADAAPGLL